VNLVTKSGSNQVHGDCFEFIRDYHFNARNFFAPERDSLKRNQFGGTLGAPIVKEQAVHLRRLPGPHREEQSADVDQLRADAAMLSGDFTAFASAACNGGTARTLTGGSPATASTVAPEPGRLERC
jgi:hypothetical protein